MLNDSKKLTDGLIIFSVIVSDYEKPDFKNDALAGVRANYFNSANRPQHDKTEICIDSNLYNLSYNMQSDVSLAWKVTGNNRPYQSVKKENGGLYSVMFYNENGIIYKRIFFDLKHVWKRTEYYNGISDGVLVCKIYPKKICGIIALVIENYSRFGLKSTENLFPSAKAPNKKCDALIYSNVGMLWYDKSFCPSDLPSIEAEAAQDGFDFKVKYFSDDDSNIDFDIASSEYLDEEELIKLSDEPQEAEIPENKPYSAYDKIEKILTEAHKSNKDLFGEIIIQTSEEDFADKAFDEEQTDTKQQEAAENQSENANQQTDTDNQLTYADDSDNQPLKPVAEDAVAIKSGKYLYYGDTDANGKRTGRGRTTTFEGVTLYDGGYFYDKRDGFGVCYYKNGSINYVGNWADNNRNGCGVGYRLSDGTMHAGRWLENSPDGYGARFDKDGNLIDVCLYSNGVRNGKSVSFDVEGNIVIKVYENGEVISEKIIKDEV